MARLPLFDAHCHLQDPRIAHCMPQLLRSASDAGVRWFAVNGTSEEDWSAVRTLSEENAQVIPNFGLHPWYITSRSSEWFSTLKSMLASVPSAAVGEVGLDMGSRGKAIDEETQVMVLKQQLNLARDLHRPVSVHCVRAFGQLEKILKELGDFPDGIVLHSYMGSAEMVKIFAMHGCYFSFSGFITAMKKEKAKKMLAEVPMERLLLETDAPDAIPQDKVFSVPSKTGDPEEETGLNHPSNIYSVLSWVSAIRGMTEEEVSNASYNNAKRLFSYNGSKVGLGVRSMIGEAEAMLKMVKDVG